MLQNKKLMTHTPTYRVYLRMEEAESQSEELYVNQTKEKGSASPMPMEKVTVKPIRSRSAHYPKD